MFYLPNVPSLVWYSIIYVWYYAIGICSRHTTSM